MGECKHEWLPKVVMADDFEAGWDEYMEAYNACDPQAFLDEMQEELDRRIEEAAKYAESKRSVRDRRLWEKPMAACFW